jgi:hypothetical protein
MGNYIFIEGIVKYVIEKGLYVPVTGGLRILLKAL